MDTFGEKLKSVREDRGLTIESASAATGVEAHHLRALEASEFDSMPGEDFILASLRAYATYLSVDADLMIEDYRYEREKEAPPLGTPTDPGMPDDPAEASTSLDLPPPTDETPPPSEDEAGLFLSNDATLSPAEPDLSDDEPLATPYPEYTDELLEPHASFEARTEQPEQDDEFGPTPSSIQSEGEVLRNEKAREDYETRETAGSLPESNHYGSATPATEASRFSLWLAALGVFAVAIFAAWWFGSGVSMDRAPKTFQPTVGAAVKDEAPEVVAPAVLDRPVTPSVENEARRAIEPVDVTSRDPEPPLEPIAKPADPNGPSIRDYGVGTGVENRQLVGERGRFHEGTQAWFWTHVKGADPGDRIHHVWLHDGVEAARVKLRIGGSSWRTHSAKTLWPGSSGEWVVEARDDAGRVLAREEFVCAP
jgi:transcriptional regulator with XRE-family HTH domain